MDEAEKARLKDTQPYNFSNEPEEVDGEVVESITELAGGERGEAIEAQRGDRALIGSFYLINDGKQIVWEMVDTSLLDTGTFAACLSQLIVNFMVLNPEAGTGEIMAAVQRGMMDLAKQQMAAQSDESGS